MPKRKRYNSKKKKRSLFFTLLQVAVGVVFLGVFVGAFSFVWFAKDLPNPNNIEDRFVAQSTKIYDRTGETLLYDIHGEERRTVIPFSNIPEQVKQATIAIEDQNFYSHSGVDIKAIFRALIANIRTDDVQGGSTITQQFIKNSILSPKKKITRKIREAILALEMERKYSKDEILGFYLNQIAYGSNAYGIEAAAQTYFGKHAQNLTLAESAVLAALPKAPSYFSPYGTHKDELMARKNVVLRQMRNLGYITREQEEEARNQEFEFEEQRASLNAPHFTFYVRDLLEKEYGEGYLDRAGLRVITTIDWELQQAAERIVRQQGELNEQRGAYNASLVAMDPQTGQVLAMVGSRDYFGDPKPEGCTSGVNCLFDGQVNVALRGRQPGSSFKPFVYATAFKEGYTDKTILFDTPTEFNTSCTPQGVPSSPGVDCYNPPNYDNRFRGPVTARQALANSLNIPAVKMLYLAGVQDSINTANDMGITTLQDRSRFGLSLVLGSGEVRLLDMVSAYSTFSTEGVRHPTAPILRIEDNEGEVLFEFEDEQQRVLDAEVARLVTDVLSDNAARSLVFGTNTRLAFPDRAVAAKTGTTNEFRDGWTLGYTPSLTVGVWAGNNNNAAMGINAPGISVAGPIWRSFFNEAFQALNLGPEGFTPPDIPEADKPILNGQAQVDGEYHSILYYINKDDPLGPPPETPDPQLENWEAGIQQWLGTGSVSTQDAALSIISPQSGSEIARDGAEVRVSVEGAQQISRIEVLIGRNKMASMPGVIGQKEYTIAFSVPNSLEQGIHTLHIRAFDTQNNLIGQTQQSIVISD